MALRDRDGLYGARALSGSTKNRNRGNICAEVTCVQGWRYPLLVILKRDTKTFAA